MEKKRPTRRISWCQLDGLNQPSHHDPIRTLLQEVFQHAMTGCFLWQGDIDPVAAGVLHRSIHHMFPPKEIEKVRIAIFN